MQVVEDMQLKIWSDYMKLEFLLRTNLQSYEVSILKREKSEWWRLKAKDNRSERGMNWQRKNPQDTRKKKWEKEMQQIILP